jgi:uncharacterized protein (DUF1015 family)
MTVASHPPLVTPFRAERYTASRHFSARLAPPYDVISPERRAELAAGDRHNVVHVILPASDGDPYASAATTLEQWRADGVWGRDGSDSVYVVQQIFGSSNQAYVRTGVIGAVSVEPYETGRVRPHEKTHAGPKEDRLALTRATRTMLESLFMLTRAHTGRLRDLLAAVTQTPASRTGELDGVEVRMWCVGGPEATALAEVAGEDALYIADGHHRFETANTYRIENPKASRIPALIVPITDPGLVVLPTHRLVVGEPVDEESLVRRWAQSFFVEEREPEFDPSGLLFELAGRGLSCVVAFPSGKTFILVARGDPSDEPDIVEIEREVVAPLRQAAGPAARVAYTAEASEVFSVLGRGDAAAGILVQPTPVERLLAVSDAGGVLPPKSTYFAPKVPSGLVALPYD